MSEWKWETIDTYDSLKEKPKNSVFYFKEQIGRNALRETIQNTRIYGSRICTHYMALPDTPR